MQFPWHASQLITLQTRNSLFLALRDQLRVLVSILKKSTSSGYSSAGPHSIAGYGHPALTHSLLDDLLLAGLNAPGISEKQKWELVITAEWAGMKVRISPLAGWWPFEVVGRRQGFEEEVVEVSQLIAFLLVSFPLRYSTPGCRFAEG